MPVPLIEVSDRLMEIRQGAGENVDMSPGDLDPEESLRNLEAQKLVIESLGFDSDEVVEVAQNVAEFYVTMFTGFIMMGATAAQAVGKVSEGALTQGLIMGALHEQMSREEQ